MDIRQIKENRLKQYKEYVELELKNIFKGCKVYACITLDYGFTRIRIIRNDIDKIITPNKSPLKLISYFQIEEEINFNELNKDLLFIYEQYKENYEKINNFFKKIEKIL